MATSGHSRPAEPTEALLVSILEDLTGPPLVTPRVSIPGTLPIGHEPSFFSTPSQVVSSRGLFEAIELTRWCQV